MSPEELKAQQVQQLADAEKQTEALQVSANALVNPPKAPTLTPPALETLPPTGTADAVATDTAKIVEAQTAEAAQLRQSRQEFAQLGNLGTLADFQTEQLEGFGVPENVRQLKDIQLQLADVDTASELQQVQIAGAAGQTIGQGQREVTQEQRENAVRRSGLAAQASVLQGNISTARTLVNDAVNTAFKDRQLTNSNLINQINDLSGTVDDQTQQLLDAQKAEAEADQAKIQEVKDAVDSAMLSGASPEEVARLTDINATDEQRLSLAQSIVARGATQERGLNIALKSQQLQNAILSGQKTQLDIDTINSEFSGEFSSVIREISSLDVSNDKIANLQKNVQAQVSEGDYGGAIASIENTIEGSFTGEVKTKFANQRTDFGVMSRLRDAIQVYTDGGGDLNLLTGKTEEISNKLLGVTTSPELTALAVQLEREFQTYRTNATGAAFSPEESRDYAKVNPRSTATLDLNLAIIDGALNALDDRIESTVLRRVPSATELYDTANGKIEIQPEEAQEGDVVEIGGKRYKAVLVDGVIKFDDNI